MGVRAPEAPEAGALREGDLSATAVALANGKGGVGKSCLSASLAVSLAEHGHKVLLFDADLGLASLDLMLGLSPQTTLRHVVKDGVDMASAVISGPEGIDVVSGGAGSKELADLTAEQVQDLVAKSQSLASGYKYVIYDTASGLGEGAMAFLRAAKRVLVVATPEPTSILDAYATTKVLFEDNPKADVSLVVNMAEDERQGAIVFERFKAIVGQFLNREVSLAAIIVWDVSVADATRAREPFILKYPKCKASKQMDALVEWLVGEPEAAEADERVSVLNKMRSVFAVFKKSEPVEEEAAPAPEEEVRRAA